MELSGMCSSRIRRRVTMHFILAHLSPRENGRILHGYGRKSLERILKPGRDGKYGLNETIKILNDGNI